MSSEQKGRRVVVVSGAGIGIGAATSCAFAGSGDHVVVTDILAGEGAKVAAGIRA